MKEPLQMMYLLSLSSVTDVKMGCVKLAGGMSEASFLLAHVYGKPLDTNDSVTTLTPRNAGGDIIIKLDLNETSAPFPSRRSAGKNFEKNLINSVFNPKVVKLGGEIPSMQMDVNVKSVLGLLGSLLSSEGLNTYAGAIARKAAEIYNTFRRHSKVKGVKPQVIEFRSGKPSLVYAFSVNDILNSLDSFLASKLVSSATDQLARRAGVVFRAVVPLDQKDSAGAPSDQKDSVDLQKSTV